MGSIRKNKVWKELYNKAVEENLDILQDKDWEATFQDIIVEYMSTGVDPLVLLQHKNNNLASSTKSKEDIDKAVEVLLQELQENKETEKEEEEDTSLPVDKKKTYNKKEKKE
jgi:hypothetical protein